MLNTPVVILINIDAGLATFVDIASNSGGIWCEIVLRPYLAEKSLLTRILQALNKWDDDILQYYVATVPTV